MGRKYYDRRCCDTDGCILEDTGVVIESPGAGKRIRYKCNQCGDVKNLMWNNHEAWVRSKRNLFTRN
jgi:hypothetical protein